MNLKNSDEKIAEIIEEVAYKLSFYQSNSTKRTKILDKIALGFGAYLEMRSGYYTKKSRDFRILKRKYSKGLRLFAKYHSQLFEQ